ncbi:MAG: HNH endonuclease signature motif containing protein, partial [Candidatus Gracilibacteria bacterium]
PVLCELFTTGKVSANKLARITSIATVENQEFLANQVRLLPKSAVETLVRDLRHEHEIENQNGLFEPQNEVKSLPGQSSLKLSQAVISKLSELQNKGLDINGLILKFLKEREEKIENEKTKISEEIESKNRQQQKKSRYILAKTKKLLHAEHGTKCAISHCQKPAKVIHHSTPFAISQSHNPHYLAPLCREHHTIAHSININFHKIRSSGFVA